MSGLDVVPFPTTGAGAGATPDRDTCLGPHGDFPADLSELPLVGLRVLHSRVVCQLEHEYLVDADGPHPVTQDRHGDLVAELAPRARPAPGR